MNNVMLSLENVNDDEEGDDNIIQAFDIILESKTLTTRIKNLVSNLENPYISLYII